MFTQGAGAGVGGAAGAGAGAASGAPGIGELIASLQSALGGAATGGADFLSTLLGRKDTQRGFSDLESQLRAAMSGEQGAIGQAQAGLQPFQQFGTAAGAEELGLLQGGSDPTAQVNKILGAFQQSPAEKATIESGLSSVQNRLQAQGLGQSGAESKALEQFAQQGTAGQQNQFLQNVLGARQQTLGGLQGLTGTGLSAANASGQIGLQGQQDISSLLQSLGLAQQGQQNAKAGSTANMIGSLGSILSSIL